MWQAGLAGGAGGMGGRGGGSTNGAGLGGGCGAEVALYLSGGDPEVAPFVLENCNCLGATISSSLVRLSNDSISSLIKSYPTSPFGA